MKLPQRVKDIIWILYDLHRALAHGSDENRRALTRIIAEQVRYELGNLWGTKAQTPSHPPSKDTLALLMVTEWQEPVQVDALVQHAIQEHMSRAQSIGITTMWAWDWQNGETRQPWPDPESRTITGQHFIAVEPINHLGSAPPEPPSPPAITLDDVVRRLDAMAATLDANHLEYKRAFYALVEGLRATLPPVMLLLVMLWPSPLWAQDVTEVFRYLNPIFSPGVLASGTSATWTFRSRSDNALARVLIDAEGITEGAAPWGYAELMLRAQDEIHDGAGAVLTSSDVRGSIRLMSRSYAWPLSGNPFVLQCLGTQCGGLMEFYSDQNIRYTASGGGGIDWVTNNRRRLLLTSSGEFYFTWLADPSYGPPAGSKHYACFTSEGQLVSQPAPCH